MADTEHVTVVLVSRLTSPDGGMWNPGERAGFPRVVAEDLIRRGIARPAEKKALDAAPQDKMVGSAPAKK